MKLAIACHPTYGGSGVIAAELGMAMADRGHEVHFVSYQPPFRIDPLHPNVHFHEVDVASYPLFHYPPYALALANKLVEVVQDQGVRLLHVHYAIPHSISAVLTRLMCRDCGIRVITTLHGTDITLVGSDPSFFQTTRFGIEASDGVTAVSEYLARESRTQFRLRRPIRVIPNFVDTREYSPDRASAALRERFAPAGEALVVHLSNFRPVKRVIDVIGIFAAISREVPARLLMVGSGPELAATEDEVNRLGIRGRVRFLGLMNGAAELLASSDLLLLPSETESFGLAALEAMACGVPVIATRAGGVPEVVEHGLTGFLGEIGDVGGMAAMGISILADEARRRALGAAGRRRAVEEFPLERVVTVYEGFYHEVMERPERA
ncbi:MAG: N-acetyl-alpha-D-glucosaminyl L-malate synthase BshA [Planctomycetota bacterium]